MRVNDRRHHVGIPAVPNLNRGTVINVPDPEPVVEEMKMRLVPTGNIAMPLALQFSQPVTTLGLTAETAEAFGMQMLEAAAAVRDAMERLGQQAESSEGTSPK